MSVVDLTFALNMLAAITEEAVMNAFVIQVEKIFFKVDFCV